MNVNSKKYIDIIKAGKNFLSQDEEFYSTIKSYETPKFSIYKDPFLSLIKYICYQQLSIVVAKSIYEKFIKLFTENNISPKKVMEMDNSKLQSCGLSIPKCNYIKEIANFVLKNNLKKINEKSDEEIYKSLISIKGVGPWTIDMYLIFTLGRADIFPIKDLGIQKGIKLLYNLEEVPTIEFMEEKSRNWEPHCTTASLYLWKLVDGNIEW